MKKGKNSSLNTKTIEDYYKRSQDNLTSGQFAPDNFVRHFKLDNFASKKIALFFLRRGMFIKPWKIPFSGIAGNPPLQYENI